MKKFIKPQAIIKKMTVETIIAGSIGSDPVVDPNKQVEEGGMESRRGTTTQGKPSISVEALDF